MRVAVISDIHANWHALEAVLAAIDEEAVDEVWCLGDLVGYGPRPNECCETVAARAAVCLVGNHDLAVLGSLGVRDFAPHAAVSALWTREVLAPAARDFLAGLPPHASAQGVDLYHASPRDPVWEYVLGGESALAAFELTSANVVLVGHSHVALRFTLDRDALSGSLAPAGTDLELSAARLLLNPGSVGQPRDGDPRAAYLVLDLAARTAVFRRVSYPVERTQDEIRQRGLPEVLAVRLATGE